MRLVEDFDTAPFFGAARVARELVVFVSGFIGSTAALLNNHGDQNDSGTTRIQSTPFTSVDFLVFR